MSNEMILNQSGLKPLGRAVLIQPYEPERKQSLIALPDTVKDRSEMVEQRAIVIDIGPVAWHDEPIPRAKIGDKVMVTKYAGAMAPGLDGKNYRLVNDRDIFCALAGDGNE